MASVFYKRRKCSPALNFKTGKKMWCISSDIKARKNYIEHLKSIAEEAREVYELWKLGATKIRMPIGVFAPRVPVLCNLIK